MEPQKRVVFGASAQMTAVAVTNSWSQMAIATLFAHRGRRRLQELNTVIEVPLKRPHSGNKI